MKVLVTGGTGYIGSHTCVELQKSGYEVVIVDNLVNSSADAVDKIEKITGVRPSFYEADLRDEAAMDKIFSENEFDSVIHFAGLKAVGESVEKPLLYYDNNLNSTLVLLKMMQKYGCKKIVFSSSATVYGAPKTVPITEDFPLSTTNPYGSTKLYIEGILRDMYVADNEFSVMLLRYFNPIGAHESGLLGEKPNGIPNNLMPRIIRVAKGEADAITIFGTDYPTPDGTGVRDYLHVVDLAKGHICALKAMTDPGVKTYNLGTGTGYSVLDLVNTFNRVNNQNVKTVICPRRPGDAATVYADPVKAKNELGWTAELDIDEMCRSSWNFAKNY